MAGHTLILNQDYTPLSLIPVSNYIWQDSMKAWFNDEARPVEYYSEWNVRSSRQSWPVPSVMVCNKYVKKKNNVRYSRYNLLLRDHFRCQYCLCDLDLHTVTVDHVVPRVKGGTTRWENVVSSCTRCNSTKGHRTVLKPRTKPIKPDYYGLVSVACQRPMMIPHKSWTPYLPWPPELLTVQGSHD
jgi:5-methylcytosine-specific restriction endonuclease McrA